MSQVCVFQKGGCGCSFVALSCPTLGVSCYSPGGRGFSQAALIGCNLLFKLESQLASSLTVYKQLMHWNTSITGHNCCLSVFPDPGVSSYLISSHFGGGLTPSLSRGPSVNRDSVPGPSGGQAQRGDLERILKCPWGMVEGVWIGGILLPWR